MSNVELDENTQLQFDRDRWKEIAELRLKEIRRADAERATNRERIENVIKGYLIELEHNRQSCSIYLSGEIKAKIQAVEEVILRLKENA
jgi:hypothetical protein